MSLASSPRHHITELLGRRALAVIPKDQLRLLEQPDSWTVDSRNRPHGQAHIPGHVLETAKQAYKASSGNDGQDESGGASRNRSVQDGQGRLHEPDSSAAPQAAPSPSLTSWATSPSRSQPRQQAPVDSSVVHETPTSASCIALPPPPESQVAQNLDSDDATSSHDEDDLEMALPQAHATADAPVNMAAARLAPTATPYRTENSQPAGTPPPCAQPSQSVVIPGTVTDNVEPSSPKPCVEGRRHRHKMIELTDSPVKLVSSATAGRRMPATKVFANDASSSHDMASSSMVPATCQAESMPSRVVTSIETTPDREAVALRSAASRTSQGRRSAAFADAQQPTYPGQLRPVTRPATQAWATEPLTHQPNPYRAFVAEYPDYVACHGGSLWNFVRACVCVDYLRRQRMLRECLFDDFVRAFSLGYLQYVARAGPCQEPLPAIEWFNLLSGVPLYTRMVVSRQNLDAILAAFPEEVKKARNIIRDEDDDDDEEGVTGEAITREARSMEKETPRVTGSIAAESPEPSPAHAARSVMSAERLETPRSGRMPSQQLQASPVLGAHGPHTEAARPPSPQLGSDGPVPSSDAPTPSASARSKRPLLSQYHSRLSAVGRLGSAGKRSAEGTEQLLEYFRRRKLSGNRSAAGGG